MDEAMRRWVAAQLARVDQEIAETSKESRLRSKLRGEREAYKAVLQEMEASHG